jgi:hypothetical protein
LTSWSIIHAPGTIRAGTMTDHSNDANVEIENDGGIESNWYTTP